MATFQYLKKGPMCKAPYHLLAEDGITSLCGQAVKGVDGAHRVNSAPRPQPAGLVCVECRKLEEQEAVVELD